MIDDIAPNQLTTDPVLGTTQAVLVAGNETLVVYIYGCCRTGKTRPLALLQSMDISLGEDSHD